MKLGSTDDTCYYLLLTQLCRCVSSSHATMEAESNGQLLLYHWHGACVGILVFLFVCIQFVVAVQFHGVAYWLAPTSCKLFSAPWKSQMFVCNTFMESNNNAAGISDVLNEKRFAFVFCVHWYLFSCWFAFFSISLVCYLEEIVKLWQAQMWHINRTIGNECE